MLHLRCQQRATYHLALPVRQPLFENLVAAKLVIPNGGGNVASVSSLVQVHIKRRIAQRRYGVAQRGPLGAGVAMLHRSPLAGHHRIARPEVAPAGGHREVVAGHVTSARGGGHSDGCQLWMQRASGHAGDGRVGVEQRCQFPTSGRRRGQLIRRAGVVAIWPARQRDARSVHAKRSGVGQPVLRVVQRGDDMVEQVLNVQPQAIQIALS